MYVRATFRHRAVRDERVADRHARLIRPLCDAIGSWLGGMSPESVFFDGDDDSGAADLTPALPSPNRGAISYCPRRSIDREHGMYDDVLTIDFEREPALYRELLADKFRGIVETFGSYRAAVLIDEDLDLDDFDEIVKQSERTEKDIDGRDGVFRIWPVSYFDDQLCRRAFSLAASEVGARVATQAERVFVTPAGVEIVASSAFVSTETIQLIDKNLKSCIFGR